MQTPPHGPVKDHVTATEHDATEKLGANTNGGDRNLPEDPGELRLKLSSLGIAQRPGDLNFDVRATVRYIEKRAVLVRDLGEQTMTTLVEKQQQEVQNVRGNAASERLFQKGLLRTHRDPRGVEKSPKIHEISVHPSDLAEGFSVGLKPTIALAELEQRSGVVAGDHLTAHDQASAEGVWISSRYR
jgi:hypothetical protein